MSPEDAECTATRSFYLAATGQTDWQPAFDLLLQAAGFDGAAFYVIDRTTKQAIDERWHRLDPAHAEPYLRDYVSIDPRAAEVFKPNPQRILCDYLHTAEADIDRDPFYAWFQKSTGHRYYAGGQSASGERLAVTLTLHRPRARGHASGTELARFGRLFDHFEHAVKLQHEVGLDATRQAATLSELECAAHGVILLDRQGGVLHANASARTIAARADGLILCCDGLSAHTAPDRAALGNLVASALAGRVAAPLSVPRRFGGHPYLLTAYPVPAPDLLASTGRVTAAIRILDPDAGLSPETGPAAALLGLTPQETRILAALLDGADPSEIAATNGLRPATIRTTLAAIYRKAGVRRQAALVARVAALQRFL